MLRKKQGPNPKAQSVPVLGAAGLSLSLVGGASAAGALRDPARRLDRRGGASVVRRPPRTERRRSYRVATWWRYRLEYRKRQIDLDS